MADTLVEKQTVILSYVTTNSRNREKSHVAFLNKLVPKQDQIEYLWINPGVVTPADLTRTGPASQSPDISRANVILLNQIYYHPSGASNQPLTPAVIVELMATHDCNYLVWIGHVFPDQFGTVLNEACYFKVIGPDSSLSLLMKVNGGKSYSDPCMRWITDGVYSELEDRYSCSVPTQDKSGYLAWTSEPFVDPTHQYAPPCMYYAVFSVVNTLQNRLFTEIAPEVIHSLDVQHPFAEFIRHSLGEEAFIAVMSTKMTRIALKAVVGNRSYELPSGFISFAESQAKIVHNSTMGPRRWNIVADKWFQGRMDYAMLLQSGVVPREAIQNLQDGIVVTIIIMQMRITNMVSAQLAMNEHNALLQNETMTSYGRKRRPGFVVSLPIMLALAVGAMALFKLIKMPFLAVVPTFSQLAAHVGHAWAAVKAAFAKALVAPGQEAFRYLRTVIPSSLAGVIHSLKMPETEDFLGFGGWKPSAAVSRVYTCVKDVLQPVVDVVKRVGWIALVGVGRGLNYLFQTGWTYFGRNPLPDVNVNHLTTFPILLESSSLNGTCSDAVPVFYENLKPLLINGTYWEQQWWPILFGLGLDLVIFLVLCYIIKKLVDNGLPRILWLFPVIALGHAHYHKWTDQLPIVQLSLVDLVETWFQSGLSFTGSKAVYIWPLVEEMACHYMPPQYKPRHLLVAGELIIDTLLCLAGDHSWTELVMIYLTRMYCHWILQSILCAQGLIPAVLSHACFNWIVEYPNRFAGQFINVCIWFGATYFVSDFR
jgi:hypothetical protein